MSMQNQKAKKAAAESRPDLVDGRSEFTSRLASFGLGEEPEPILEDAPPARPSGSWTSSQGCP
jgi:hypothetical protein